MSKDKKNIASEEMEEVKTETTEVKEETATKEVSKKSIWQNRKFRYGTTATILTVAVAIVTILLNIVFSVLDTKFPLNWDLTNEKLLTLSTESKDYAKNIKDSIEITICSDETTFSSPSTGYTEMDNVLAQYYSALQQYKTLSKGKVTYRFVDLTTDVTTAASLSKYNVNSGSLLYTCGDRYSLSSVSDLYSYDDNYETYLYYKQMGQTYEGEYSFNSLVERSLMLNMNKITGTALKPVTLLTGHDEDSNLIDTLTTLFENNGYEVKTLNITTMDEFDGDSNFAILPAPSTDYSADELKTLRDWVQNGGKLDHQIMYVLNYSTYLPNLAQFFNDNYGIEPTANWIVETSTSRMFSYYIQYTYGDVAETDYTTTSDKWVKSPVTFQLKTKWTNDSAESKYAKSVINFPNTARLLNVNEYKDYEEKAQNGNTDLVEPEQVKADAYPISGMAYSVNQKTVDGKTASSNAFVCGSSLYFTQYLNDSAVSNQDTFLAVFNGLAGNENNVTVASKSLVSSSLDFGSEATKKSVGLGLFTIGLPVVLLIIALVIFLRRKNL
ncbi:MAG: GldG family protein [Clostridia bacterium]|nr:GldG family protein [Clostridia bacterium]